VGGLPRAELHSRYEEEDTCTADMRRRIQSSSSAAQQI